MCVRTQHMKGGREGWANEASRGRWVVPPQYSCCCCWREIFLFSTSLHACLLSFLPWFPSLYTAHICCGCTLQSLPSFVSFSFISASYHFPHFLSRSNGINNLFCEFPYLLYIAPVDLLGLIPSLRGIGSYGSNQVPLSPKALKIEFYPPSFFKAHFCSSLFYFFYIMNAGADCVF